MKKKVSQGSVPSERSSYHHPPSSISDRKCDNCRYKVAINECTTFRCKDCGTYIVTLSPLRLNFK